MADVSGHYLMVALGKIAAMLPSNEARVVLYKTVRALMSIAAGHGTFVGAYGSLSKLGTKEMQSANETLCKNAADEAEAWTAYLAQEAAKYQGS